MQFFCIILDIRDVYYHPRTILSVFLLKCNPKADRRRETKQQSQGGGQWWRQDFPILALGLSLVCGRPAENDHSWRLSSPLEKKLQHVEFFVSCLPLCSPSAADPEACVDFCLPSATGFTVYFLFSNSKLIIVCDTYMYNSYISVIGPSSTPEFIQ